IAVARSVPRSQPRWQRGEEHDCFEASVPEHSTIARRILATVLQTDRREVTRCCPPAWLHHSAGRGFIEIGVSFTTRTGFWRFWYSPVPWPRDPVPPTPTRLHREPPSRPL